MFKHIQLILEYIFCLLAFPMIVLFPSFLISSTIKKKSVFPACVESESMKTPAGKATAKNPFHTFLKNV